MTELLLMLLAVETFVTNAVMGIIILILGKYAIKKYAVDSFFIKMVIPMIIVVIVSMVVIFGVIKAVVVLS